VYHRLYVLELEDGCYYIGITRNFSRRMREHFNGGGSRFTRKLKPIRVVEKIWVKDEVAEKREREKTDEYIKRFGIEKVRGGDHLSVGGYVPPKRDCSLQRDCSEDPDWWRSRVAHWKPKPITSEEEILKVFNKASKDLAASNDQPSNNQPSKRRRLGLSDLLSDFL